MTESGIAQVRTALEKGNTVEAEKLARTALERDPEDSLVHAYLGAILMGRGAVADALQSYRLAIELQPEVAVFHNEFGTALAASGEFEEAAEALTKAAELSPEVAEIRNNLGNVHRALGDRTAAAECYRAALAIRAEYPEALTNLGVVLQESDDLDGAEDAYRRALVLDGENPFALTHLGVILAAKGELTAAEKAHLSAIESNPKLAGPYNNLGIVLKDQGRLDSALEAYEMAIGLSPNDSALRSNVLLARCCLPRVDEAHLFAEHVAFAERFETGSEPESNFSERGEPRLRIGYVSPDFYSHSVASFAEPIIAAHDRARFHVTCYSDVIGGDAVTQRIRSLADAWRDTADDNDEDLHRRIVEDGIDVLIDLAGHTADNRMGVFARRAAPVQVSWIGYPATTGLSRMDYRVTDTLADPKGDADLWHTETLLRLESGFLCYRPPDDTPIPVPKYDRAPTFGSFNNFSKVNDKVIDIWSELLVAEPRSRLMLKCRQLADEGTRNRLQHAFFTRGVGAERLILQGRIRSREAHMALYGEVDVALDTFPYNGTTTTCEALWMGVPVVTMSGERHAARVGDSLLSRAGWPEWIARDKSQYIEAACRLVAERPKPQVIRDRLAGSSIMDAGAVTGAFEAALGEVWRRRCRQSA